MSSNPPGQIQPPAMGEYTEVLGRLYTVHPQDRGVACEARDVRCTFATDDRCQLVKCEGVVWFDPITFAKLRLTR